jgi:hypothetical protein
MSLDDVAIHYEEYQDGEAWERFLSGLIPHHKIVLRSFGD